MSGRFMSQRQMAEDKRDEARHNAVRKRLGLHNHPVRTRRCGCGYCGSMYWSNTNVDMRTIKLEKNKQKKDYDECHHFS